MTMVGEGPLGAGEGWERCAHLPNGPPCFSTHIQVTSASLTWGWLCTYPKARRSKAVWAPWATWVSPPSPWPTSLLGPLVVMCPVSPLLLGNLLYLMEQKELMFLFYK